MGDVIKFRERGSPLETLAVAAEECGSRDDLKAVVVLIGEDAGEVSAIYSEQCDPISVHYALSMVVSWQLGDSDED